MGCCSSNIQKPLQLDLPVEEREIQLAEKKLSFSHRKLEELLGLIQNIDFPLDVEHFANFCELYNIPQHSSTGRFFYNLLQNKALDRYQLRPIFLLLCERSSLPKINHILCEDKKSYLSTIQILINTSIEIIPNNLENIETGVLKYTKQLKIKSEIYMDEMSKLPLEEIQRKISEIEILSRELRVKMLLNIRTSDYKRYNNETDLKVIKNNHSEKYEKTLETNDEKTSQKEDLKFVVETIENDKKIDGNDTGIEVMPEMEEENFVVLKAKVQEEEQKIEEVFEEIVVTMDLDMKKPLNQDFEDYSVEVSETDLLNDSIPSMNSRNEEGSLSLEKGKGKDNVKLLEAPKRFEVGVQKTVLNKVVNRVSDDNLVEFEISDDSWLLSMDDDSLISPFRPSDCVEKNTDNPDSVSKILTEIDKKSIELANDPKIVKYSTSESISKDSPKASTHSKFKFPWPESKSPKSDV
ncbi:hypothetical protein SteCoe_33824 [Stentor coeruleus]|uniref:Uncharacterized protein n=1 Tax=Stentor coeruleus TaxID=5963 RepID=A0A1R2AVW6_9CILI|nr:hypothetical protein SteCoe_33824 [Stentor coeruleus]